MTTPAEPVTVAQIREWVEAGRVAALQLRDENRAERQWWQGRATAFLEMRGYIDTHGYAYIDQAQPAQPEAGEEDGNA